MRENEWFYYKSYDGYSVPRTHRGRDKMAAIVQTTTFNWFLCTITVVVSCKFQWFFFNPIDIMPVLVLIIACGRLGDKQLSEPMMVWFTDECKHHSASRINAPSAKISRVISSFNLIIVWPTKMYQISLTANKMLVRWHSMRTFPVRG